LQVTSMRHVSTSTPCFSHPLPLVLTQRQSSKIARRTVKRALKTIYFYARFYGPMAITFERKVKEVRQPLCCLAIHGAYLDTNKLQRYIEERIAQETSIPLQSGKRSPSSCSGRWNLGRYSGRWNFGKYSGRWNYPSSQCWAYCR
jgi:hypothetical protein